MDKLTDEQVELYENLFFELRAMYQNGQAWADNSISFRQVIEDFVGSLDKSGTKREISK